MATDFTRRTAVAAGFALAAQRGWAKTPAEGFPWRLPPLRKIQVDGHSLAYFEAGSGPPLVLVHGMSGSAAFEWGRVIGPLSKRFRVIAPYQIGFGPSAQPDLAYDAAIMVQALGGLMRALDVHGATLVGESYGGWVVAQYAKAQAAGFAARGPLPPISRLVIVDGAVGLRPSDGADPNRQSLNDPAIREAAATFMSAQPKVDNAMVRQRAMQAVEADMVTPDMLPGASLPTLLIWGEGDALIPLPIGRRFAAGLPGARLVVVRNCGHIPSVERPAAFLEALTGFT